MWGGKNEKASFFSHSYFSYFYFCAAPVFSGTGQNRN
jgi:hypothetical protein